MSPTRRSKGRGGGDPEAPSESSRRERSDAPLASFEAAFLELQQVVERLEDGSLELEQALQLFERGNQLVERCQRLLDSAELRVTRLTAESASPLSDVP